MKATRFGILDDAGKVVRWTWDKPGDGYQYVVRVVKVVKPAIDLSSFEPAPF